jgi:hypothetical protein
MTESTRVKIDCKGKKKKKKKKEDATQFHYAWFA